MSNLRILFVEDNLLHSAINCAILRDAGYEIIEACCAKDAVDVIDRHDELDALVTDIDLGCGQDGFDVARHARDSYPDLPVVFVSGTAAGRIALEGVKPAKFIPKPFHPQRIIDALDDTLPVAA